MRHVLQFMVVTKHLPANWAIQLSEQSKLGLELGLGLGLVRYKQVALVVRCPILPEYGAIFV